MRFFLVLAALGLIFAGVSAWSLSPGGAAAEDQTVDVGNLYFCSPQFESNVCDTSITAGDTVTWSVSSGVHTVTECNDTFSQCPPAGGFDSSQLQTGATFSQTFNQAGSFEYFCAFHPTDMRGRVIVAAAQATPTATPAPTGAGPTGTTAPVGGTPAAATATAARLPVTGGEPVSSDAVTWAGVALIGLSLLAASGGFAYAARRR